MRKNVVPRGDPFDLEIPSKDFLMMCEKEKRGEVVIYEVETAVHGKNGLYRISGRYV